ncbi:hypothetical protein IPC755_28550 [Pseudomonas aeruginosa]|uniref:hypothetical protein n=1 Tax=Pseudomonas aeruginosa TaxID=287 RepID=UPI000FC42E36|nr:hypothetical protein [Pseudomonas aeruginosa]RUG38104.1 hypothetical protein IPC755_28550 [Pseudomonas aeruginosa]
MKIKSIVLAIVSTALISSTFAFEMSGVGKVPTYAEFAVKRFAIKTSKTISASNSIILPVLKDKANHLLGNKTNGLFNLGIVETLKLTNDTPAQKSLMQCSIDFPAFAFSKECHEMRYKNYMTKYNTEPLVKLQNKMIYESIIREFEKI